MFPTFDGIISEDYLYFEGIKRPVNTYMFNDSGYPSEEDGYILEKYFNDVYNLFLRKISYFASDDMSKEEDIIKIQALLQELIKVKKLINSTNESNRKNLV